MKSLILAIFAILIVAVSSRPQILFPGISISTSNANAHAAGLGGGFIPGLFGGGGGGSHSASNANSFAINLGGGGINLPFLG